MNPLPQTSPVVFFDGECNLCNGLVQFIITHDKKKQFLFVSLQSAAGIVATQNITDLHGHPFDSVILYYEGKWQVRSSAALNIFFLLGGVWTLVYGMGMLFPRRLRDMVYNYVARKRYKLPAWCPLRN